MPLEEQKFAHCQTWRRWLDGEAVATLSTYTEACRQRIHREGKSKVIGTSWLTLGVKMLDRDESRRYRIVTASEEPYYPVRFSAHLSGRD